MKKLIFLVVFITLFSVQAFAQDTVETLKTQIESATSDSDRVNAIANSNAFDPIGFYNLGNALARLGHNEAAIAAYRKAITQRKGFYSRALNNLGVVLLRTGRWDEAQESLVSALRLENFHYAEASYNLGRVYAARGQNDLAAREWRRVLAIDPQHNEAKQALANTGNEERIVVATSVKPVKPVSTVSNSPVAPKTLTIDQASYDLLQRARSAVERGKTTEAVEDFQRLLRRQNGYFPPANLELSYALLTLKRYDEARTNLLQVSQRDGARYPISYFHLARIYERNGELKLAEAAFAQVAPTNAQFLLDLSRVREKLGDYKGSLDAMERYIKLMQDLGQKPNWSDERLSELRTKAAKQ
ncbi:MAG TPA: tetratricopeptide repeat protein [Pyrinomonadaceae bacterium]|jgi:tetratricopeptide (TPR) repeat protein